jgi:hypothetical protein
VPKTRLELYYEIEEIMEENLQEKIDINKEKFKLKNYYLEGYFCESCGKMFNFYEMSTCDNCGKFVCDNCSVETSDVIKYPNDIFRADFMCNNCVEKLNDKKI